MTARFTYADPNGAWSEDLGNQVVRLGSVSGLAGSADVAAVTGSQLSFDDPSATVGHSSDAIVGWKYLFVDELAAPSGNQRIFTGLVAARDYTHALNETDSLRLSSARHIETQMQGVNALLALEKITGADGNRPRESPAARVAWIIASDYVSDYVSSDATYIAAAGGPLMDANDYRPSSTAADVLADCCLATGFTAFLIWDDESATKPVVFFDNLNTSTEYSTAYRLSNVSSEIDSFPNGTIGASKTFSFAAARLHREPDRVGSEVAVPYRKGWVNVTDAATATAFIKRSLDAPSQSTKSSGSATTLARRLLRDSATEADTLSGTVEVPVGYVNAYRYGQKVSVHDSHAPGYSGFNDWRILDRSVRQDELDDAHYLIDLTLVPVVSASCSTDLNLSATVTAAVALDAGTTTWAHATIPCLIGDCIAFPADDPVSSITVTNPANTNDGDATTYSSVGQSVLRTTGTVSANWYSDLGSAQDVCSMKGTQAVGSNSWQSRPPDAIYSSDDGLTWTPVGYHLSFTPASPAPQYWVATFPAILNARYWRISYSQTATSTGPFGLWNWMPLGLRVYDWKILG